MHIKKPKQFMLISGAVLILLAFGIIWLSQTTQEPPYSTNEILIERPDVPQEAWPRILKQIEAGENKKDLINPYDGYKITIPSDWRILDQSETLNALNVPIYTQGAVQEVANRLGIEPGKLSDIDMFHVHPILAIFSQPKNSNLSLTDWIKQNYDLFYPQEREFNLIRVNGRTAYKTSAVKLIEEEGIVENSFEVSYILQNKKEDKVYMLTCVAEGESFFEQRTECEESVQTFETAN